MPERARPREEVPCPNSPRRPRRRRDAHARRAGRARSVGGAELPAWVAAAGPGRRRRARRDPRARRAWRTPSWPACPPVTGLYTTIACLVGYAVFGPSRVLVLGPGLVGVAADLRRDRPAARRRRRPGTRDRARRDAGAARRRSSRSGSGSASSGFVADLLSSEVQVGYMNGLGDHDHRRPAAEAVRLLDRRRRLRRRGRARSSSNLDETNADRARRRASAVLVVLLVLPRITTKVPAVLVAVVGATVVSAVLDLAATASRPSARCPQRRPDAVAAVDAASATSGRCSSPRSASRWCRSPTRSRRRRASRPAAATRSTRTRR